MELHEAVRANRDDPAYMRIVELSDTLAEAAHFAQFEIDDAADGGKPDPNPYRMMNHVGPMKIDEAEELLAWIRHQLIAIAMIRATIESPDRDLSPTEYYRIRDALAPPTE